MTIRNGMQPLTLAERERVRACMREHREHWLVNVYRANYSAFNGGHRTPSDYSEVRCARCGRVWRTKAAYVEDLARSSVWA